MYQFLKYYKQAVSCGINEIDLLHSSLFVYSSYMFPIILGGGDFTSIDDVVLTFPEGETRFEYNISITPDTIVENDENFRIDLSLVNGRATIDQLASQTTVTIADDDSKSERL